MRMNTDVQTLCLEDFEPIPEAKSLLSCMAINISPNGHISINSCLQREIKKCTDSFKLGFELHKTDKRILRLFVTDSPNYSFLKSGSKKDPDFTRSLVSSGISLPAKYVAEWNSDLASWIAISDNELKPDSLSGTLGQHKKGNKNGIVTSKKR